MKIYASVGAYLKDCTPDQKNEFERIRKIVKKLVPEAEEVISYGMPTFKYNGKYLLYWGAFKNHMSLFPGSALVDSVREKLDGFKLAKGTIQFTAEKPVPEDVITELVMHRFAQLSK